jgi:hypothetical protein
MSRLEFDKRVEASMDRLRAMGLKFYVETMGDNECYIVIDMKSVVRLIDSKITYPSRRTYLEGEYMIIHFWRGEAPDRRIGEVVG